MLFCHAHPHCKRKVAAVFEFEVLRTLENSAAFAVAIILNMKASADKTAFLQECGFALGKSRFRTGGDAISGLAAVERKIYGQTVDKAARRFLFNLAAYCIPVKSHAGEIYTKMFEDGRRDIVVMRSSGNAPLRCAAAGNKQRNGSGLTVHHAVAVRVSAVVGGNNDEPVLAVE